MLTLPEYEQAMLAQANCLLEAGFQIRPEDLRLNGILRYMYGVLVPPELVPEASKTIAACSREYSDVVDRLWAEASAPLAAEVMERSREAMADCLMAEGYTVADRPADSTEPAIQAAYQRCLASVQESFDLGALSFGIEGDEAFAGTP